MVLCDEWSWWNISKWTAESFWQTNLVLKWFKWKELAMLLIVQNFTDSSSVTRRYWGEKKTCLGGISRSLMFPCNISRPLVMEGQSDALVWVHHNPIMNIFLAMMASLFVRFWSNKSPHSVHRPKKGNALCLSWLHLHRHFIIFRRYWLPSKSED